MDVSVIANLFVKFDRELRSNSSLTRLKYEPISLKYAMSSADRRRIWCIWLVCSQLNVSQGDDDEDDALGNDADAKRLRDAFDNCIALRLGEWRNWSVVVVVVLVLVVVVVAFSVVVGDADVIFVVAIDAFVHLQYANWCKGKVVAIVWLTWTCFWQLGQQIDAWGEGEEEEREEHEDEDGGDDEDANDAGKLIDVTDAFCCCNCDSSVAFVRLHSALAVGAGSSSNASSSRSSVSSKRCTPVDSSSVAGLKYEGKLAMKEVSRSIAQHWLHERPCFTSLVIKSSRSSSERELKPGPRTSRGSSTLATPLQLERERERGEQWVSAFFLLTLCIPSDVTFWALISTNWRGLFTVTFPGLLLAWTSAPGSKRFRFTSTFSLSLSLSFTRFLLSPLPLHPPSWLSLSSAWSLLLRPLCNLLWPEPQLCTQ